MATHGVKYPTCGDSKLIYHSAVGLQVSLDGFMVDILCVLDGKTKTKLQLRGIP
jgi:hypothetical protein